MKIHDGMGSDELIITLVAQLDSTFRAECKYPVQFIYYGNEADYNVRK